MHKQQFVLSFEAKVGGGKVRFPTNPKMGIPEQMVIQKIEVVRYNNTCKKDVIFDAGWYLGREKHAEHKSFFPLQRFIQTGGTLKKVSGLPFNGSEYNSMTSPLVYQARFDVQEVDPLTQEPVEQVEVVPILPQITIEDLNCGKTSSAHKPWPKRYDQSTDDSCRRVCAFIKTLRSDAAIAAQWGFELSEDSPMALYPTNGSYDPQLALTGMPQTDEVFLYKQHYDTLFAALNQIQLQNGSVRFCEFRHLYAQVTCERSDAHTGETVVVDLKFTGQVPNTHVDQAGDANDVIGSQIASDLSGSRPRSIYGDGHLQ